MAEHSPTPWTPRRSEVFDCTDIRDVFDAERREVRVMGFGLTGGTQAAANADLIVRAVNAHAGMLEALRNLLWAAEERDRKNRIRQFDEFVDAAKVAISIAEGR